MRSLAPTIVSHRSDATPAASLIASEIMAAGPIPFRRFMELAIFAPSVGYHERVTAGPGTEGDYLTSPELHGAFGALLCGLFEEMWRWMGRPSTFWLIEGGPGTGAFAADVLGVAHAAFPRFAATLRIALIERSERLRARQAAALATWAPIVRWLDPAPDSWQPLGMGCVFANELLDAFPVHRVAMRADGLREIYVGLQENEFAEIEQSPSSTAIGRQLATGRAQLREGQSGEVNLDGGAWVSAASELLTQGYIFVLDYGEPARHLYGPSHPGGTLRCFRRHVMNQDPYTQVGVQDITAHVDLSAIARAAESAGLTLEGATRQGRLLRRLGLADLADELTEAVPGRVEQRAHRAALRLLSEPLHLGRIAALLFGKAAPPARLTGFAAGARATAPCPGLIWELRGDPLRLAESM